MSDVTISYKGADIATMDASGTKTLQTQGKYCEGDISVAYVKPSGGDVTSTNAVLTVSVLAGSTVVATKGLLSVNPVILPTSSAKYEEAVFVFDQSQFDAVNPWTITSTKSGTPLTGTIVISAVGYYEMTVHGELYLFLDGDERAAVTGGWDMTGWGHWAQTNRFPNSPGSVYGSNMVLDGLNGYTVGLGTQLVVDVTQYKTLTVVGEVVSNISSTAIQYGGICTSKNGYTDAVLLWNQNSVGPFTRTIGISALSGSVYFYIAMGASVSCKATISSIKLSA